MPALVNATKANTLSVTIPATTAGNCLVVLIMSKSTTGAGSVSGVTLGGVADNFAAAVVAHGSNGISTFSDAFAWVDRNCAGGQTAIVVSGSALNVASGSGGVVVLEFSGVVTVTPVDQTKGTGNNSGGATFTSGTTATTTVAREVWAGCGAGAAGGVVGPGAPWIDESPAGGGGAAGYQIVSATGTATYSGTCTSSQNAGVVLTLKGTAAAAVPAQQPGPAPRPAPRRAWIRFRPVATTNAAPPRTLLVSLAAAAGVDDYGNTYPQGVQVGGSLAPQVDLLPGPSGPGSAAEVQFPIKTASPALSNTPNLAAALLGALGELVLSGPATGTAGAKDWVQEVLFSNDTGGSPARMEFRYINNAQAVTVTAFYDSGGWVINTAAIQNLTIGGALPLPIGGVSSGLAFLPYNPNDPAHGGSGGTTWASGERTFMDANWVDAINANFTLVVQALINAGIVV